MARPIHPSNLELQALSVLWHEGPSTVAAVHETLPDRKDRAYTTVLSVMQVLHEGLADSKYRPCPLLVKYVEAGWLGRKTQRGFYDYRGEKPVPTR